MAAEAEDPGRLEGAIRRTADFHERARLLTRETARGKFPNLRPRDAATLIILDESGPIPKLLMGQRHMGHRFMPGKYVFPGGRVEPQDYLAAPAYPAAPQVQARLGRGVRGNAHPRRAQALVNAALRETREETGLVIAASPENGAAREGPPPLAFIARAITPAGRPRRFDTRFFVLPASAIADRLAITDGEFSAVDWLTLRQAHAADLPLITRVILAELEERLRAGAMADAERPVPFYFRRGACFHRILL